MNRPITDGERDEILDLLRAGHSHNEVARRTGRSQTKVSNLAKQYSIAPVNPAPSKAIKASVDYCRAERQNLINLGFEKIQDLITSQDLTARDMKDLATAAGILIDKRRLEDGEATGRHEQRYSRELNLEQEFRRLDEELKRELRDDEAGL